MSFEYSCGDFIAGAYLSYKLIRALSESQGACIEYQEAIAEITSLQETFILISTMKPSDTLDIATINAASHFVMSSMNMIGDFLVKTREYRRKAKAAGGPFNMSAWQRMGWVLFKKEELTTLKNDLHQKISNINVHLQLRNIMRRTTSSATANEQIVSHVEDAADDGTTMAVIAHGYVANEQQIATNEVVLPLPTDDSLPGVTADAIIQSYVEQAIFFQDVLGRRYHVPFEKCRTYKNMHKLLTQAFKDVEVIGPQVRKGLYSIHEPGKPKEDLKYDWTSKLQPGMSLTMSMWPLSDRLRQHQLEKYPGQKQPQLRYEVPRKPGSRTKDGKKKESGLLEFLVPSPFGDNGTGASETVQYYVDYKSEKNWLRRVAT